MSSPTSNTFPQTAGTVMPPAQIADELRRMIERLDRFAAGWMHDANAWMIASSGNPVTPRPLSGSAFGAAVATHQQATPNDQATPSDQATPNQESAYTDQSVHTDQSAYNPAVDYQAPSTPSQAPSTLSQERAVWEAQCRGEALRLQEQSETLAQAWLRLEAEQRRFLQIQGQQPPSDFPSTATTAPNPRTSPDAPALDQAVHRASGETHEPPASPQHRHVSHAPAKSVSAAAAGPQSEAAAMQFQRLRREMRGESCR
ncbi:MAG: hypothetical protein AAF958_16380 [Planctomycetota bacterium]